MNLEQLKSSLEKDLANPNGYWNSLYKKKKIEERWVNKFVDFLNKQDSLDDLFIKFERHNNKQIDLLSKMGVNGQSSLNDIILKAFEKIGEPMKTSTYNLFTVSMYHYKGYVTELIVGQGSFISIYKLNNEKNIKER